MKISKLYQRPFLEDWKVLVVHSSVEMRSFTHVSPQLSLMSTRVNLWSVNRVSTHCSLHSGISNWAGKWLIKLLLFAVDCYRIFFILEYIFIVFGLFYIMRWCPLIMNVVISSLVWPLHSCHALYESLVKNRAELNRSIFSESCALLMKLLSWWWIIFIMRKMRFVGTVKDILSQNICHY